MLKLSGLNRAEKFVREQQDLGANVRWDGWEIVYFRPEPSAASRRHGSFKDGVWGYENRSVVDEQGVWEVDFRNIKKAKR
jgi:hypothetical protein